MNEDSFLSAAGTNLIKHFEGCRRKVGADLYKAYFCPANTLVIGYGHTNVFGKPFLETDCWSGADCDRVFLYDLSGFGTAIKRLTRVRLSPHQYDALVSFVFSTGAESFAKSVLLQKLNDKDYGGAAAEILRWNRAGGKEVPALTQRRTSEQRLFFGDPDEHYNGSSNYEVIPMQELMPHSLDTPTEGHLATED